MCPARRQPVKIESACSRVSPRTMKVVGGGSDSRAAIRSWWCRWVGEVVGGTEDLDGAVLAVVAGGDAEVRLLIGRQGIANFGDGADESFQPISSRRSQLWLRANRERAASRERQKQRAYENGDKSEASEVDGGDGHSAPTRECAQPTLGADRAHREQHGIGRGDVVVTALVGPENYERNEIHEGDHAVAAIAQEADEAGDPERRGSEIGADEELSGEEAVGAAFADVARVNVLEEGVGDRSCGGRARGNWGGR